VPKPAYVSVLFLFIGVTPVALYGGPGDASPVAVSGLTLLYLIPVLAIFYIARTSTRVDADGIRVNAVFGSRVLPWEEIRGLTIDKRNVYAVLADGSVRLPCVRQRDLTAVAAASGDHLPELPEPPVKAAPGRRG
jgi:hypothetical protein